MIKTCICIPNRLTMSVPDNLMLISPEIRLVPTKVDIHVLINHVFGYLKCKQFLMRNIEKKTKHFNLTTTTKFNLI